MHQLFAALFAMLLSFSHHAALSSSAQANFSYQQVKTTEVLSFPVRDDLARGAAEASYAVSECLSCRTMNVSYTAR